MKRLLGTVSLVFASLLAGLLLGEIALRLVGYSAPIWYEPDRSLGWTLRPGVSGWFTREGRALVRVNAAGRRDRDTPLHKPDDVYRIAVLGDSYSLAMQVEREQAYWALLPERLEACGFAPAKRIEVLNFGVSGYGTAQEYVMLESQAIRYRPDLVLLQFTNGNDVRNNSFVLEEEKHRPFYMLEPDGTLRMDESFASAAGFRRSLSLPMELLRRATDRSRLLQLLREVRNGRPGQNVQASGTPDLEPGLDPAVLTAPRDRAWEEAWKVTEGLIAKTAEYAHRNGARFLLFSVPYAIQVHPDRALREALQAKLGVQDLFYPDRRLAELGRKRGLTVLALAPEMQRLAERRKIHFHGFESSGLGRGHWNAEGHRAAAELIALRLCADPEINDRRAPAGIDAARAPATPHS